MHAVMDKRIGLLDCLVFFSRTTLLELHTAGAADNEVCLRWMDWTNLVEMQSLYATAGDNSI